MKKICALIAVLVVAGIFVFGCQKQEAPKPAEQPATTPTTTAPEAAPATK